jgi:hypothetical protein
MDRPRRPSQYAPLQRPALAGVNIPTLQGDRGFPSPTRRWCAGERRKYMRDTFNTMELSALKIARDFDLDGSSALDKSELESMFTEFRQNTRWSYDFERRSDPETADKHGTDYIWIVAGKGEHDKIKADEMLFGLKGWYVMCHDDDYHIREQIKRFKFTDDQYSALEKIDELLEELNQGAPVAMDEVNYVKIMAMKFGGKQDSVNLTNLQKAVSVWYVNVERAPTDGNDLDSFMRVNQHMFQETHNAAYENYRYIVKLASSLPVVPVALPDTTKRRMNGDVLGGEHQVDCALHPNFVVGVICFPLFVGIASLLSLSIPLWLIHTARSYPHEKTCEFDLNGVLQASASLCIASVICNICKDLVQKHCACLQVQCLIFTLQGLCELAGLLFTIFSSSASCGHHLYIVCKIWFFYKFVVLVTCFSLCCCYFYFMGYKTAHEVMLQDDAALTGNLIKIRTEE